MDQNIVFYKTKASLDTLNKCALKINSRLKFTFMLVDGKSNVRLLCKKAQALPNLEYHLEKLALLGYIQVNDENWSDIEFHNAERSLSDIIQNTKNPLHIIKSMLIAYTIMTLGKHSKQTIKLFKESSESISSLYHASEKSIKITKFLINEDKAEELEVKHKTLLKLYK